MHANMSHVKINTKADIENIFKTFKSKGSKATLNHDGIDYLYNSANDTMSIQTKDTENVFNMKVVNDAIEYDRISASGHNEHLVLYVQIAKELILRKHAA